MILRLEPRGSLALANKLASHPEVAVAAVTGSISEVTRWATPIRRFLDTAPDRGSMMGA